MIVITILADDASFADEPFKKHAQMKTILVPTDFSECALHAAKFAAGIAKITKGKLIFLHVIDIPSYEFGILPGQDATNIPETLFMMKRARQEFQKLLTQDFLQGIEVAEAVQMDGVYDSIDKQAKENGVELIVMGTHGTRGYTSEYFVGSNTDKVIRQSSFPVIAIRNEQSADSIKRIVFASDFEETDKIPFESFKKMANVLGAHVQLLRVVSPDDFAYSAEVIPVMREFAEKHGLEEHSCHVHTAPSVQNGIVEFAKMNGAGLIATVTHGRRGLSLLLNGSVTSDVTSTSHVPVMTKVF
jgi:nucleotide-binding universal stress UspA family protein